MKKLSLIALLVIAGCDKGATGTDTANQGSLGSSPYVTVDTGNLASSGTGLKGQGSIAFKDPVGAIGARKSYALAFSLDDGGSLTLVANADESLKNGLELKFSRTGNSVAAAMTVGTVTSAAKNFVAVDGSQALNLTIDIHNDEAPAHVMIWSGKDYSAVNAILDSETDDAAPGQGRGTFWGLKLNQATVTEAVIAAAKFTGE
ncbi:MAG: hypothetical protein FJ146_19100 [Deltaproteobacteria bacterium]|nr:hypothetical protein [Deltaproteobacteria bacterium]